ncbi:uncharacterized protein F5Z01DRAFT_669558 [Emericellopsis atlantica]|uniref:ARB-07466-like C-terminal domain-containing protein n=1 Tax=Emericellopsis atlantica TaxID=2614577 RepID=A0A9P7ZUZ8_9HYPO|nr:uncharacterized protein F5Z01DRAFT_669558 [Emericellopsis atlantica]KAG9258818.1 hypothetical protein F5Z01DRAFT_669558 [Emericellopsis atlantica]
MLFKLALLALPALAAVNGPCYGPNNLAGVCVSTSACSSAGGTSHNNLCPWDGADIKCCTKPSCQGSSSACGWTSDCAGTSTPGLCPGPSQSQCCSSTANGWGGYPAPSFPAVGSCKAVAVDGARTVVAQFPGRVREIFCIRDCACPGTSDHCCGMAIDFMIADGGGQATLSGIDIAEWVMDQGSAINLKYVIWGQKIWHISTDGTPKPWSQWRTMEDRGDITQNHWDHVHVSFQ